jgi:integrase
VGVTYKRGKGCWWISYNVSGRRFREPGGPTRETAKALLNKRELEVFEGRHFPEKRLSGHTMADLRDLWLAHAAQKRSLDDDRQRLERLVEHLGASTQIAALRQADVATLRAKLAGTPMAPATVNRYLAVFRSALNIADANGWQHRDPMKGVELEDERNERDRICTEDEFAALTAAAQPNIRLAITLAYWTAMRVGEIAALEWGWIDLRAGIVKLPPAITKTGDGRRVPLSPEAAEALRAWPRALDGRVFTVVAGTISSRFSALTRRLGIVDLRLHDMRHTALTRLRRAGVDLFTMQRISGHRTLEMLRRYQTVTDEDLRAAVDSTAKKPG